ncbi:hypothetical protein HZC07_01105 [Candidatus Micrarchaeota archaeon]|nr:hypothetical protein [Candidatus Micrarchaeota archaeon]
MNDDVPTRDDEGEYTIQFRRSLLRSLDDLNNERVCTEQEIREKFNLGARK